MREIFQSRISLAGATLLIALAALLGIVNVDRAQADGPFQMEFDRAEVSIGNFGSLPLGTSGSDATTISGTITGTNVSVPRANFNLPSIEVEEPIGMRFAIGANSNASGRYYPATGEFSLNTSFNMSLTISDIDQLIEMLPEGSLGDLGPYAGLIGTLVNEITCSLSPLQINFSTEAQEPFKGVRFIEGLEGSGAIAGAWTDLPPFTGGGSGLVKIVNDIVCPMIANAAGIDPNSSDIPEVPGALRLSRGQVDPVAPALAPSITGAPASGSIETEATFAFNAADQETEPVTGFQCRLDGGGFESCQSPKQYAGLSAGSHTFQVRAANDVGSGPAESYSWTIATPPPPEAPVSLEAPVVNGQPYVGWQLACVPGSWGGSPKQVIATWTRDGVPFENLAANGTSTKRTYVTQPGDIGSEIACYETGKNPQGTVQSDSSNAVAVIDIVPLIDQAPVLTTSNATFNQVVPAWNLGWQLRGTAGSYSNPTGNPWIGIARSWAQGSGAPIAGTAGKSVYVSQLADLGEEIVFVEVATNIFGTSTASSNATAIVD